MTVTYKNKMQVQQHQQESWEKSTTSSSPRGPVGTFTGIDGRVYEYEQNKHHDTFIRYKTTLLTPAQHKRISFLIDQEAAWIQKEFCTGARANEAWDDGMLTPDRRVITFKYMGEEIIRAYTIQLVDFLDYMINQNNRMGCLACIFARCNTTNVFFPPGRIEDCQDIVRLLREFEKENCVSGEMKKSLVPHVDVVLSERQLHWFVAKDLIWLRGAKHF